MKTPAFHPPPRMWQPDTGCCASTLPLSFEVFSETADTEPSLHPQGYRIQLSADSLHIAVGSPAALRYAWQHFEQWTASGSPVCGILEDAPELDRRGFMLDISRCKVPTRESLQEWVRMLSEFRYNEFQLYTEHTFAYSGHETVWKNASPMTVEDVRWLQDLCEEQGISLVPNQNCFGHFERWIQHPAYRQYAESPDGFTSPWGDRRNVGSVLKPDAESLRFVRELLDELLPLFKSPWVNIGCDETFELGQGHSRDLCEQLGPGKVYTDFLRQIMAHVKNTHGKKCQFWGDIILKTPELLKELPREAMALEWGYEADHPFEEDSRRFAESGLDFMICPGTSSWNTFAGRTENMLENIRRGCAAAKKHHAKGVLLTDWGDNGHLQQNPVSVPGLAWCALNAWSPGAARVQDAQSWGDAVGFDGQSGDTACWMEAGRVQELLDRPCANCSRIHKILRYPKEVSSELDSGKIHQCLEQIGALPAPRTCVMEWEQTLRNMRLALHSALALKGETVSGLQAELKETVEQQRNCWRMRNREGGLAESLEMYTPITELNPHGDI